MATLEIGRADSDADVGSGAKLGKKCYEYRKGISCCCCFFLIVLIIILPMSFDVIEPTQYALLKNSFTGVVDLSTVYGMGRHFVGPAQYFIKFPSNYVTLAYGNSTACETCDHVWNEIRARSGAAETGESSGGQPVTLSISFQYKLKRDKITALYQTFGEAYEESFLRFAQQEVTSISQQFTPSQFWIDRRVVERAFLTAVNGSLLAQGIKVADVPTLQLRGVSFQSTYEQVINGSTHTTHSPLTPLPLLTATSSSLRLCTYEQTITNIQLQDQLRFTKGFQMEVTRVNKQVSESRQQQQQQQQHTTLSFDPSRLSHPFSISRHTLSFFVFLFTRSTSCSPRPMRRSS